MSQHITELLDVFTETSLLQSIEASLMGEDDAVHLQRLLAPALDKFLNLNEIKPNSPSSRKVIQSGSVTTAHGVIILDQVPDVVEVLLLSDDLQLDELDCLAYILAAQEQTGQVSARAAAGVYYEERLAAIQSVLVLFHAQVTGSGVLPSETYSIVATFNAALLSKIQDGRTVILHRIADLIQSSSLCLSDGTRLPEVVDKYGRVLDRAQVFQRECTTLCHSLLYACCIKQRMTACDIQRLLDLLHHLVLHSRAAGGVGSVARHQANLVLMALLLALLPLEDVVGPARAADDDMLRSLAKDSSLDAKIRGLESGIEPTYFAAVRLSWGILSLCCSDSIASARSVEDLCAALKAGVLDFFSNDVLGSLPMGDEAEDIRLTSASVVHQLLMLLLEVGPEGIADLRTRSKKLAALERDEQAIPGTLVQGGSSRMIVDHRPLPCETPPPVPDSLGTLLKTLAAVLEMRPALYAPGASESLLSDLMQDVGNDSDLMAGPSVFLGYMAVLSALTATEMGARMIFAQLGGENAPVAVSWRRLFGTLTNVIRRYDVPNNKANGVPGQRATSHFVLSIAETKGLCAFTGVFTRVMQRGPVDEVLSWVRQLDNEAGVSPSWELLFQTMCCPVPQNLKAALNNAIAAIARQPELAAALWERLLSAVVVLPYGGVADTGVARYDLVYQLNEIEAREENYSEAIAFIGLLNALWSAGSGLVDDGRSVAHFTRFVRDEILSTAFQRSFIDETQRWKFLSSGLDHCRLCLENLTLSPAAMAAEVSSAALPRPPGLEVLLDLLGEQNVARAALTTLSVGVDKLALDRYSTAAGAAKETAVLAALRLLCTGFHRDSDFVLAARRSLQRSSYDGLEAVLLHDRSRIPVLLEYVRYPFNTRVQEEALRLANAIIVRIPNLVLLILTIPLDGAATCASERMQSSFASCLHDAFGSPQSIVSAAHAGDAGVEDDQRSGLVLDVLLSCMHEPTPNFSQLLCGFDMEGGVTPLALHDPRALHTPLRVAMEVLAQPPMAVTHPRIFEQCLELVYQLAAGPDTGPAMRDLLRAFHSSLAPLVAQVACAPLPNNPVFTVASLHQRAWLLQLLALQLHHADVGIASHREGIEGVLLALFGNSDGDGSNGLAQVRGKLVNVLAIAARESPAAPQLGAGASAEVRRMIQLLDIETLVARPGESSKEGICVTTSRGDVVFDVIALKDELLLRYNDWVARHGAPAAALKEAGRVALSYAADFNAYVERLGGQAAVFAAWRALIVVAFTRRFDVLAELAGSSSRATDCILAIAEDALDTTAFLLRGHGALLAPALCSSIQALFARLQEHIMATATSDPMSGMPLPPRCHSLLSALLAVLWDGRSQESVRLPLYSALVSYIAMSKGPGMLHAPPAVLSALLDGVGGGARSEAAVQLDTAQGLLEEGNVAALHSNLHLISVLAADAVDSNLSTASTAITVLSALVGYDPTTLVSDEVHKSSLPARLLQDLRDQATAPLATPAVSGQAVTLVAEAQLTLLLQLALAGPVTHRVVSAQKLYALQTIPRLTACRALDLQPEEPGFISAAAASMSLRHRMHLLITPTLRLVLSICTALPQSDSVWEQIAEFVDTHSRTLARILRDAASPGVRGWEPSDAELDEATLAIQLLSEMVHRGHIIPPGAAPMLQEAAFRAACRFLVPNSRCQSPPVVRVHAAKQAGSLTMKDERTYAKVIALRSALAVHLHALSSGIGEKAPRLPVAPVAASSEAPSSTPTLFLIKDALVQAAVYDLPEILGEQFSDLRTLRSGDMRSAEEIVESRKWATPGKGPSDARAALVRAASLHQADINRLIYLTEHLLAILYLHLRIDRGAENLHANASLGAMKSSHANMSESSGSYKNVDQLRRLVEPAIAALERILSDALLSGDTSSLELLIRRTKECLLVI